MSLETRVDEMAERAGGRPPRDGHPRPAIAAETQFGFTAVTPATGTTIRRLAALRPRTLAVMHGSSFTGDAAPLLERLARFCDERLQQGLRSEGRPSAP